MKFVGLKLLLLVLSMLFVGCSKKPASVEDRSKEQTPTSTVKTNANAPKQPKTKSPKPKFQKPTIEKKPVKDRLYDGKNLSHWKAKFKTLDATTEEAKQSVDGLIAVVRDEDLPWFTRKQAGRLLGKIGKPAEKAVTVLVQLIRQAEQDDSTVTWSVQSLAAFGTLAKSATPDIVKIAKDRNRVFSQRISAIDALTRIGSAHHETIPCLIELLSARMRRDANTVHEMWQLRKSAAEALRVVGPDASSAVPALVKSIRSSNEELRLHAIRTLGAIGPSAEPAIPTIAEAMVFDDVAVVCDAASKALGAIGPKAIPVLIRLLENATAESKARIASSFREMGAVAKPALEHLDGLLDDDDGNVRLSAALAIWKISGDERISVPAIVQELTNPDRHIRRKAYEELLRNEFSIDIIKRTLDRLEEDERGYVRSVVKKILRKLSTRKKDG